MTDEQRDNLLLSMFEALNNLDAKFEKKIQNLDVKFEQLRQEVKQNRQEALQNHKKVMKELEKQRTELERQRMNMAKLENNLTEQIRALFDVKVINEEKLAEHDAMIENIEKTLDWHHGRILKLETTN